MSKNGISMFRNVLSWLLIWLIVAWGPIVVGQEKQNTALDIIPSEAIAAVAVNNFKRFEDNLALTCDRLKDGRNFVGAVPSIVKMFSTDMKMESELSDVLIEDSAAAIIVMNGGQRDLEDTYLVLPIKDMAKAAKIIDVDAQKLVDGKIIDLAAEGSDYGGGYWYGQVEFVCRKGNFLLLSTMRECLQKAIESKPLRAKLSKGDADTIAEQDLVVSVRPKIILEKNANQAEFYSEFVGNLVKSEQIESGILGLQFNDGVGATVLAQVDGSESQLSKLIAGDGRASLQGLPDGKLMISTAFAGNEKLPEALGEVVDRGLLKPVSNWASIEEHIPEQLQANLFRVFKLAWTQVNETRFAAYLNDKPGENGLATVVTLINCKNADEFVKQMISMESFINASLLPMEKSGKKSVEQSKIDQLIEDLSSPKFRTRELASTKLALLGDAAELSLRKALKSNDIETSARAREILNSFEAAKIAAQRDAIRFEPEELSRFQVQFAYVRDAEAVDGQQVSQIRLHFAHENQQVSNVKSKLQELFGRDWDKIRLFQFQDTVAFVWGSEKQYLEKVVANLTRNQPGLASKSRFASFYNRTNSELTAQFHVSLSQMKHLIFDDVKLKPRNKTDSAISLGLQVAPGRIRVDTHLTIDEIQMLIEQWERQ